MKRTGTRAANPMESALAIIADEHRAFDASLAAIIDRIRLVRAHSVEPDTAPFERSLAYLSTFMDHFHHPKEDDFLFKAVGERSAEAADLIEELQHEHAQSPAIFAELMKSLSGAAPGSEAAFEDFSQLMERFAANQLHHMHRENHEIVPIARRYLRAADWREIHAAFAANRDPLFAATLGSVGGVLASGRRR